MRPPRYFLLLGALLALGCSDATSPARLAGTWRQDLVIPGSGVAFTLTTNGDAVSGAGEWTGEACCSGPVTVTGTTSDGDVTLSLSFVANGNVVPPRTETFEGRLVGANVLAGTISDGAGSSGTVTYRRVP